MQREQPIPANVEAERGFLGLLMSLNDIPSGAIDELSPEEFTEPHNHVFKAIQTIYRHAGICSTLSVSSEMERQNTLRFLPRDEETLREMCGSLRTLHPLSDLMSEIKSEARYRRLYAASAQIAQWAISRDADAMEKAEQLIASIAMGGDLRTMSPLNDLMVEYLRILDERCDNFRNGIANGVPTNFPELDRLLGGLQPDELTIIAARPSVGKTAISLTIALNIVRHARRVFFVSLEMSKHALAQRLVAMEAPVDQMLLRAGNLDEWGEGEGESHYDKAIRAMGDLSPLDLLIDDRVRSIAEIKSVARFAHTQKPLHLLVIDYLQLIRPPESDARRHMTKADEIGQMSRALKELAMELHIPILVLSQLNRSIETRGDKNPQLSDLRDSGNIEQDADAVLFLGIGEQEMEKRKERKPYSIDVTISKQRNGPVGDVTLTFMPRSTRFQSMESEKGNRDD